MARTLTRSIRVTMHELAWIKQVASRLGMESYSDSEALRTVMYLGLETATGGKWTGRNPDQRWLEYAESKMTAQLNGKSRGLGRQGVLDLRSKMIQAGMLTSGAASHREIASDEQLEHPVDYTFFGRTEAELRWEKSALEFMLETDPSMQVTVSEMLDYDNLIQRDPDNPEFCDKVARVVVFRARFLKANFASKLTEQDLIQVDKLIADGKAEKWI